MVMNMDRRRYQTIPMVGMGIVSVAMGRYMDGPIADMAKGAGIGLAGTEFSTEKMGGTPLHHDQIGAVMTATAEKFFGTDADVVKGLGAGAIIHHVATEGLSVLPTKLQQNTDKVIP
jgi:hypothetical protein